MPQEGRYGLRRVRGEVGSANVQETWEACCESCKNYKPEAPHFYPCNIWVFCPEKDGCFAPAAGDFIHGQCWLKFQEDPTNSHVNMRGDYSAEYRKTHPSAPSRCSGWRAQSWRRDRQSATALGQQKPLEAIMTREGAFRFI